MQTPEIAKQQRMHIRLDAFAKQKLEKAANYSHKSLSEFVLSQALTAAEQVISQHEKITLSAADWEVFLDALENPPPKNDKLKHALQRHQNSVQPLA